MKTMTNVMENKVAVFFFLFIFVSIVDAKRRDIFDIIEKKIGSVETRISVVETRINSDNELKSSRILVSLGLIREKQWTRDQVEKLTGLVNEQTGLLNQNFSELKNEFKRNMNEVSLKSDTTEQLISAQQREIETLKETQAKLLNIFKNYMYKCPSYWTKYSSYCYLYVRERKTFSEARAHCKRLGATLSDIENKAKNTFIRGLERRRVLRIGYSDGLADYDYWDTWIGYSDEKEEGTWRSERTGQPASFTNFDTSQPDGGTAENCACMGAIGDLWYDTTCDNRFYFSCKKDAKMDIKF